MRAAIVGAGSLGTIIGALIISVINNGLQIMSVRQEWQNVILGLVILSALWFKTRQGAYGPADMNGIESGAAYWHMVDLVWIVLFPLVYVMR